MKADHRIGRAGRRGQVRRPGADRTGGLPDPGRPENHRQPDGGMEVAAFDHETSARARIDADVGEPGTVLVPGRLLAAIAAPAAPPAGGAGQRRPRRDPDGWPHPVHLAPAASR